tara:strand:- start:5119 stop:5379 length:261 start_codon:yes stop_codon:yes gene_type:complete
MANADITDRNNLLFQMVMRKCNRLTEGLLGLFDDANGVTCSSPSDCTEAPGSWKIDEITCGRVNTLQTSNACWAKSLIPAKLVVNN